MNYIVFFSSFLKCIEMKKYDKEYIDYQFVKTKFADNLDELLAIEEYKAVELANLIYQIEVEKDVFYSQYFDKKIITK